MATTKIELLFSDETLGCKEFGFIPRVKDTDDEDLAYERHVRRQYRARNINCTVRVIDGTVSVSSD